MSINLIGSKLMIRQNLKMILTLLRSLLSIFLYRSGKSLLTFWISFFIDMVFTRFVSSSRRILIFRFAKQTEHACASQQKSSPYALCVIQFTASIISRNLWFMICHPFLQMNGFHYNLLIQKFGWGVFDVFDQLTINFSYRRHTERGGDLILKWFISNLSITFCLCVKIPFHLHDSI